MAAVIFDEGLDTALATIFRVSGWFADWKMLLWTGALVPAQSDVLSAYTALETTLAGYARQTVYGGNPTIVVSGHVAQTAPVVLTFTFSAYVGTPVDINGYCVFSPAFAKALFGERFSVPFTVPNAGGNLLVVPRVSARQL